MYLARTLPLVLALALPARAPALAQEPPSAAPAAGAPAPHAEAPTAQALRISTAVRVDGRMDEEAWARATPVTSFTQVTPDEGRPASERTEIRILFDADAIYVGARLHDSAPPTTRLGRRDAMLSSDWLTVIFDSYHDHRTAFGFEINPSGVRRDQSRGGGREDDSWDPVWEGAAVVDSAGWTAEMRIPFSQLRFNPSLDQTWGLQLERTLARRGEFSVFSFTPSTHPGGVQRFAHLHGLRELRTGRRMEVLPYVVARGESVDRGGNPFRSDRAAGAAAGVDVKYRLTSDLTLDATVNPDFGQVEVDPAEVNLSAIETFFQERRPFFVEGSEIFSFGSGGGNNVFYSRRIGRAPQLPVPGPADVPDAARILAAGKLSGRTGGGWSVGFLGALTERVEARSMVGGAPVRATAEPFAGYGVARLRRDARAGAPVVGGMLTAVHRDLDTEAARLRLHDAAYTGGVDVRHQWGERAWTLSGFASGSWVHGEREALLRTQRAPWRYAQRPDAPHLELDSAATSLAGLASEVSLAYRYGRHWRFLTLLGTTTPGYEVNDLGYQARADRIDQQVGVTYIENRPRRLYRSWNASGNLRQEHNYAGDLVQRSVFLSSSLQGRNFWNYNLNFGATLPSMDDRLTRGGPLARRPSSWRVFTGVGTDWRKPVNGFTGTFYQRVEGGGWTHNLWSELEVKPAANVLVRVGPSLGRTRATAQYLGSAPSSDAAATFGRHYLFAELRQTTLSLDTRLDVTFTPALSLQVFAQPFVSSADFGPPRALAAPRTFEFVPVQVDVGDRDFNVRSLRGNAVLRWEWRPGSTLYVAWQQERSDVDPVGDFRFGRDRAALFGAQPDNVLMLKVNYWLNP
jgi:hypothetical protein